MIDLDALDASIAESEKKNFFVAPIVKELIAELRHARGERAAVVAWLRYEAELRTGTNTSAAFRVSEGLSHAADCIERGEHLRSSEGGT